jgi:2-C-methyl-D-erythritol 2,4-cyclodiphosphate synthase
MLRAYTGPARDGPAQQENTVRVGIGYALLPFEPGRVLILGGVKVTGAWGLRGRADGDVVLQAVCDALLGSAALGDLGDHFPADDPAWKDVPSAVLVAEVVARVEAQGLTPVHVDVSIVTERANLDQARGAMRERLSALLGLDAARISVKRTPAHGVGAVGAGEGMAALAVATVAEVPA